MEVADSGSCGGEVGITEAGRRQPRELGSTGVKAVGGSATRLLSPALRFWFHLSGSGWWGDYLVKELIDLVLVVSPPRT